MKFALKPTFISWITIVPQAVVPVAVAVLLYYEAISAASFELLNNTRILQFGLYGFIAIFAVRYLAKRYNYKRTEYVFYNDRLEFSEGFLTLNHKTIKYKDIREVTLRRGVLQRIAGVGSIYLATIVSDVASGSMASNFGLSNITAGGILVRDIKDSEEQYKTIKELVHAAH